jgi:hypothetical protein
MGTPLVLFAHDDEKKKAEFEAFKEKRVAFISDAMNLTKEEAKEFWPLCNELTKKKFEADKQFRKKIREFQQAEKEGKEHSENEYRQIVELFAEKNVQEAKLEQEYISKFAKVISYEKISLYQRAEKQFQRKILEQHEKEKKE